MKKITKKNKSIYILTGMIIGLYIFMSSANVAAYPSVTHPSDQSVSAGQSVTITWFVSGENPMPFWTISGPGVYEGPSFAHEASCESSDTIKIGDSFAYTICVSDVVNTIYDTVYIRCQGTPGLTWYLVFGVIAAFGIIVIFKYHRKVRMIN